MRTEAAVSPGAIQHGSRLATNLDATHRTVAMLATATLVAAIAYGCVAQGGFYRDQQRTLLALVAVSGVFAALAAPSRRVGRHLAIAGPAFACAVIAALAAGDLGGAAPVLGIVGAATAAALVGRSLTSDLREQLVTGLLVAGVALALTGWAGVAFRVEPLALVDQGLWRASSTLTYANATAAVLAPLALVALARRSRLTAALLMVGVGATLSRAGWAALAVGVVVLALSMGWHRFRDALPILLGSGVATAGVALTAPERLPSRPGLAVATLLVGLGIALVPAHHPRRWLAAAGVLACGGIALASVVSSGRLTLSSPDRANEWRTTWAVATAHPLSGVGPSHLKLEWRGPTGHTYAAHATHNEFLQLAAEQGFVALAVALATIGGIAAALLRRAQGLAVAVLVAFVIASAFDFVWHVALIPIVVAALTGTALPFDDDQNSLP